MDAQNENENKNTEVANNKNEEIYEIKKEKTILGKGAFGTVYLGTKINQNGKKEKVALKEIPKQLESDDESQKALQNEIDICQKLRNTNIVKMIKIEKNIDDKVYLVYELCNGGDLRRYMDYFKTFDEELIQIIMIQIVNALFELHDKGVIHHDIKPENILIQLFPGEELTPEIEKKIKEIKEVTSKEHNQKNVQAKNDNPIPNQNNAFNKNNNNAFNQNNINAFNQNNNNTYYQNNNNAFNRNNTNPFNKNNNIAFNQNNNNTYFQNNNYYMNNNMNQIPYNQAYTPMPYNQCNYINPNYNFYGNNNFNGNYYQTNNNLNSNFNNFQNFNMNNNLFAMKFRTFTNQNIKNINDFMDNNYNSNNTKNNNNQNNQNNNKVDKPIDKNEILKILKKAEFKLSDFGLSKINSDKNKKDGKQNDEGNRCGSPLYMSPELFLLETTMGTIENQKVDIWALGILAFEMFFGRRPFEAYSIEQLSKMFRKGEYYLNFKEPNITISKQFVEFLNLCLQDISKERSDVFHLRNTDFVNIDYELLEKLNESDLSSSLGFPERDEQNHIILRIDKKYFE